MGLMNRNIQVVHLEKQVIRRNFSKSEKNCGMIGETSGNDFGTIPSLHEYRVFTPEVS